MIRAAHPDDLPRLLTIWREAVTATHHFLTAAEIERLTGEVEAWLAMPHDLLVAVADGEPAGFIAMEDRLVEALFVHPAHHGRGLGRALLAAVADRGRLVLDVNEANPAAIGFYERLGFERTGRSDVDAGGRPYPVLHMRGPARIAPGRDPKGAV